jgi:hypothetical protein
MTIAPDAPEIYDIVKDVYRPVTQADVDRLERLAMAALRCRATLNEAVDQLPPDPPHDMSAPHG